MPTRGWSAADGGKMHRIGYLGNAPSPPGDPSEEAFQSGLREWGWVEGQNIVVVRRYAEGRNERFPALAASHGNRMIDGCGRQDQDDPASPDQRKDGRRMIAEQVTHRNPQDAYTTK